MAQKCNNREKLKELRNEFPEFIYEKFIYDLRPEGIDVSFHFNLSGKYHFRPSLFIPSDLFTGLPALPVQAIPSLVFHIGMIELISYWKCACPPRVTIKSGYLSGKQIAWWKHLYFNGLGEFLYLNSLDLSEETMMNIECSGPVFSVFDLPVNVGKSLVPVGGGKDSAVSLELLKKKVSVIPMMMNPGKAGKDIIRAAGIPQKDVLTISRTLDPVLLELNARGFLNGHTPFSALLGFVSLLAAVLTGSGHIVLSNESSASEATIPGTGINHQYSKSYEFERDFRMYIGEFLTSGLDYFSFLRPLNELQIAGLFSRFQQYHSGFRSCNAGSKTSSWCGRCPKCLFTFVILSPFLERKKLISIFGKDLLADLSLSGIFDQITGKAGEKPFECVGTVREVNLALKELTGKSAATDLPLLLQHYLKSGIPDLYRNSEMNDLLSSRAPDFLPPLFEKILNDAFSR